MTVRPAAWLLITTALVLALLAAIRPLPHAAPVHIGEPEGGFDQPDAAAWHDLQRRAPADRSAMPEMYERASAAVARLHRYASRINRVIPATQPATRVWFGDDRLSAADVRTRIGVAGVLDAWTPLGPGNIGGRTRVVTFHPTTPTTLFAAGVSGGIWRSTDDGGSWRPIGDGLTNININSMVIDPQRPDTIFVGTGEGYFREEIRGTGLPLRGGGIYMTRNGGATWQPLESTSTPDFYWVNDLELGVADKRRIFAATRTGVWRSQDAGATWQQLLSTNVRGGCLDLALRPDRTDDVLFASCGSYEQATVYRFPRAADRDIVEVVLQQEHQGRTSLAIAPSNPDVMYALAASNDGGPGGNYRQGLLALYRSTSGGDPGSWQTRVTNRDSNKLNTLLLTNPYAAVQGDCSPAFRNEFVNMGWYINVVAVDPLDAERVWAGGVSWFRSDDGGRTFGMADWGSSGVPAWTHVDQHGITFHPNYNGTTNQIALVGNDGGVFRTTTARGGTKTGPLAPCTTGGAPDMVWTSLNRGYGVTQFYHGTAFPDGVRYIAGAQDNGTLIGQDQNGTDGWRTIFGGDGGYTAVNPQQSGILYVELQWATLRRSLDTGGTMAVATFGLDPIRSSTLGPEANYLFVTPFILDPNSPNRLWLGGEYLYRSTNGAQFWSKVGSVMPDEGLISALAVRPGDADHLVIGTHKGDILWSRNATANLNSIRLTTAARPRSGWVTSIAHDERTPGVIYATYGNFGGHHVYRSTDFGETWTALPGAGAGALPDIPVHSIVVDPDDGQRLYLGTDLGVMVSTDAGASWMSEETGFGPAVTMWLQIVKATDGNKYLFAFTHGRGAWRVRLR
ncbi:MAG TPA: hypothetical protein VEA16_17675 [Vicinamibacterales bacterium]|nr:hypothetical protein [Vicinamibacterales bacterium]